MFYRYLACSLALVLFIQPSMAQKPAEADPAKPEQQESRKALEQKALALLEEVIKNALLLKLDTNRLRIQMNAADLLWPRDEKRARALFEKSVKDVAELVGAIDNTDPAFYNLIQAPSQLYNELLQMLLQHDPQMALDFVHSTHLPQQPQAASNYVETSFELQMESQIASQIAGKDPKLALQVGLESLNKGFSSNIIGLIYQLQERDREGAAKLANALIKKLLTENLLLNNEAANVAISLLIMTSRLEAHAEASSGKTPAPVNNAPLIDAQAYKDLMELVVTAALRSSPAANPSDWRDRNIAQTLLTGLQNLKPNVEKVMPTHLAALERKIADLRASTDAGSRFWQDYQDVFQKGSVDDILGLIPKVAPDLRDQVYQQAAWKALSQGDSERARQIINDGVSNPLNRRQMLDEIERQSASKAASEGKLEQARLALSRLRTNEDRATALIQLANTISSKGDKKTALRLLEEASTMIGSKALNYTQLQAQMQVARSFTHLDPARSFEILESISSQFNELLDAAEVLNGFEQQYYKDGELLWQGTNLGLVLFQIISDLSQLAPIDFDRTTGIAGRFQRPEARLMAQLLIARAVLSDQRPFNLPTNGRGFSFSRSVIID